MSAGNALSVVDTPSGLGHGTRCFRQTWQGLGTMHDMHTYIQCASEQAPHHQVTLCNLAVLVEKECCMSKTS